MLVPEVPISLPDDVRVRDLVIVDFRNEFPGFDLLKKAAEVVFNTGDMAKVNTVAVVLENQRPMPEDYRFQGLDYFDASGNFLPPPRAQPVTWTPALDQWVTQHLMLQSMATALEAQNKPPQFGQPGS